MPDYVASVTIDGQEYRLAPLRCKHLKEISQSLKNQDKNSITAANAWDSIAKWTHFIGESIRLGGAKEFKDETLDELTLTEFLAAWTSVTHLSGIAFSAKAPGEATPMESTGQKSTAESVVPSDGRTVM